MTSTAVRSAALQPHSEPQQFRYVPGSEGGELLPAALDPELARTALAHALWAGILQRNRSYRLP